VAQEEVTLEIEKVSGDVYCLSGAGGNIGILKTEAGLLVIDSGYEKTAEDVSKKITAFSPTPIKYLINTHYHGDHTGGNKVVGKDAVIIMHPNCKDSLTRSLGTKEAEKAYIAKVKPWKIGEVIELGEETVRLLHFGPGHTAGDIVVVFEKSKVLHTGDLFFNGMPPYIDVKDGANTGHWIRTIEALCTRYVDYKVIPGHGKVTTPEEYLKFADYLKLLRKKVTVAIAQGKTREQAMETIKVEGFENLKEFGNFLTIKNNIGWVYDEMTKSKKD
jgi:glyoxylase-like metal-dependent hydrolase (beta-lactamase superfamily II)